MMRIGAYRRKEEKLEETQEEYYLYTDDYTENRHNFNLGNGNIWKEPLNILLTDL